jgi:hypothetical protein
MEEIDMPDSTPTFVTFTASSPVVCVDDPTMPTWNDLLIAASKEAEEDNEESSDLKVP